MRVTYNIQWEAEREQELGKVLKERGNRGDQSKNCAKEEWNTAQIVDPEWAFESALGSINSYMKVITGHKIGPW